MMYSALSHVYGSHEDALVEFYGIVSANGSVAQGCTGLTITNPSAGNYVITVNDLVPITAADLSNASMSAAANGTGATKTVSVFCCALNPTLAATNQTIASITFTEAQLNSNNQLFFNVVTQLAPSTGGAGVATSIAFSFRIVISTIRSVRF